MGDGKEYMAIGLMSGTSVDAIDAALLLTDGERKVRPLGFTSLPFDPDLRLEILGCMGERDDKSGRIKKIEKEITLAHSDAVRELMMIADVRPSDIDVIGFHGQTITHDPASLFSWQLGDGALMAAELGIDVVCDFRSADIRAGGQGAPLLPLYHRALVASCGLPYPVAVLNIGGIANVTFIGGASEEEIIAFDTGPGNALLNDFLYRRRQQTFDRDGMLAASGTINQDALMRWLSDPYFSARPPKSLDRNQLEVSGLAMLSDAEGAATLTAFTVFAVRESFKFLPRFPDELLVTGGGRKNAAIMAGLCRVLEMPVRPVEDYGWKGDAMEAEGFAYLAVRSLLGLHLSLPKTTGVPRPVSGGRIFKTSRR